MGAVWSALLVGGGLAGALFLWLLRGDPGAPGKDGGAEPQEGAPLEEAAAPGGGPGGGGGPEPSDPELVSKAGILPPLESVVLKFSGEGGTNGTRSRAVGFWWTSFPDPGLSPLQPSPRSGGCPVLEKPRGSSRGRAQLLQPQRARAPPLGRAWCSALGWLGGGDISQLFSF